MKISGRDVGRFVVGTKKPDKNRPRPYDVAVGRRLRLCRDAFKMTWDEFTRHNVDRKVRWEDITDAPPLTQSTYSQYETGARPLPGYIAAALARLHGITTDYLYHDDRETLRLQIRSLLPKGR